MHSGNAFSKSQAEQIIDYIIGLHPEYAERLYGKRCFKCHDNKTVKTLRLTEEQWQSFVLRERAKSVAWISLDEAKDIADYLAKKYPAKNPKQKTPAIRKDVEKKCIQCHLHKTVFKPEYSYPQWLEINERMRSKVPLLISNKDAEKIAKYLSDVNPLPEWE